MRTQGHDIEHQVGSAGFFIDLAVRDPQRPGRYVLGIECDGAAYHSTRSARDRDRLRQQVLEGLGWKIHRIWSTDWFRDPGQELRRVEKAVSSAHTARATAPPVPKHAPERSVQPLERGPEPVVEIPVPTCPYRVADLYLGRLWQPLHETYPGTLAKWICKVVEVESPVHLNEVMLRVRGAAGLGRSGSRIREQMRRGAKMGLNQGLYRMDGGDFLWRLDHETLRFDGATETYPLRFANPM